MNRHMQRRRPKANGGFSWGRIPGEASVTYRLFRRDHTGALHVSQISFLSSAPVTQMASTLKIAKRRLRDTVDELDLAAMGIAA